MHSGTIHGGHYFSFIKNEYNQWYIYNDAQVRKSSDAEMREVCFGGSSKYSRYLSCGYLLVYEKLSNKIYYPEPIPVPQK